MKFAFHPPEPQDSAHAISLTTSEKLYSGKIPKLKNMLTYKSNCVRLLGCFPTSYTYKVHTVNGKTNK